MTARHRVPHKGSRLLRNEDPARSRDPRVRAVVAQLQTVELPAPSPHFRAELRAQLVAVAPRLIADGIAEQRQAARKGERRTVGAAEEPEIRRPRFRLGRPLAVLTTFVAVCALVLGGAVWLSRKSLPGDALYGLKRASETVQLKLDFNDTDRATDYLHFSQTRVQEAQDLVHRSSASGTGVQADGVSPETTSELTSTLKAADDQLLSGWNLLAKTAKASNSSKPLATMKNWAPGQIQRLETLQNSLPPGPLHIRATKSTGLARFALTSANTLTATLPKPTSEPALPTTHTPEHVGRTGTKTVAHRSSPATTRTPAARRPAPKVTTSPVQGSPSASTSAASKSPTALLPSLLRPLTRKPKPLVSSCGISLPIGIRIGHCKTHS